MRARIAVLAGGLVAALTVAAAAQSVNVSLNGSPISLNPPPVTRDGRVFVPLRGVFEQLGATVVYSNGTINAQGNGHSIQLHIGSTQVSVDGNEQQLDVAPFILGASTYVPLRFVSQALGATVDYDAGNRLVALTSGGGAPNQTVTPQPQRTYPPQPPAASNLTLRALQPGNEAQVVARRPRIEAQFDRAQADPNSLRVTFDGLDVTNSSSRSASGIVFSPPSDLQIGQHVVQVSGRDLDARPFDRSWQFTTALAPVPQRTAAPQPPAQSNLTLRTVQPESYSTVDSRRPTIQAQFDQTQADPNSVRVMLDGLDVTNNSSRSPSGIVYSPPSDLQSGRHSMRITGRDVNARPFDLAWQFDTAIAAVARPAGPPQSLDSGLTLRGVRPENNTTVDTRRPTIEAQFGTVQADPYSLRVAVDGRDVTRDASRSPNGIAFAPADDLRAGRHVVQVTGRDVNDRPFDRSWQFTTGQAAVTNFIDRLEPADNARVAPGFLVTGRTQPNARVIVQVGTTGDQQLSIGDALGQLLGIGARSNTARVETTADGNGMFSVQIDLGTGSGQALALVVDSTEPRTQAAARVQRTLTAR